MQHSGQPPSSTGPEDEANTVSAILREARESLGESLEDVAKQSRISRKYLEALEDGRFSELPGNTYTLGFIRTYADHLRLDSTELVNRYKAANENAIDKTKLDFPEPLPETGLPGGTILFAGIVVAILAYGGWYVAMEDENSLANLVSPVPDYLAENIPAELNSDLPDQLTISDPVEEEVIVEIDAVEPETTDVEPVEAEVSAPEPVVEASVATPESLEVPDASSDTAENETEAVVTAEPVQEVEIPTIDVEPETIAPSAVESGDEPETSEPAAVEDIQQDATANFESIGVTESESDDGSETLDERNARLLNEAQLLELKAVMGESGGASDIQVIVEELIVDVVTVPETAEPEVAFVTEDSATKSKLAAVSAETMTKPVIATVTEEIATKPIIATVTGEIATKSKEPRVYGESASSRILITATTNSWAEVRDTISGELLLTRLLRTGDSFHVPNRPGISLVTGNAGGLEILVDGQIVPPIGPSGAVRHDVVLDPELLKSGAAAN